MKVLPYPNSSTSITSAYTLNIVIQQNIAQNIRLQPYNDGLGALYGNALNGIIESKPLLPGR